MFKGNMLMMLDMPNPKPKILFNILTLVKNHYIKVLPDKNSYLQWCESLVVFRFICLILMMESVSTLTKISCLISVCAVQSNFERHYGRNSNNNYKNRAKKVWSECPALNIKCYLVCWHLLGTILLKFYLKKIQIFNLFWEFGSFPFLVKFNDKKCKYPRKHPRWRVTATYSA